MISGSGHLYVTNHYEVKRTDPDAEMQFVMEVQKFLSIPEKTNDYLDWAWSNTYDMWDIRNWLGYSVADVNMRKPLSQQDQQKVSENFELLDNIYATQHGSIGTGHWEKEDEQVYLRKSDILTEGSIRMTFTLDSLKTKNQDCDRQIHFHRPPDRQRHAHDHGAFSVGRVLYLETV